MAITKNIGNYIHARYDNYIRFGINKPSDGKASKSTWSRALKSERRRVGNLMREQENAEKTHGLVEKEDIEMLLGQLLGYKHRRRAEDYDSYAQRFMYEAVRNYLQEKHGNLIDLDSRLGVHKHNVGTTNKRGIYQTKIKQLYDVMQKFLNTGNAEQAEEIKKIMESLEPFIQGFKEGGGKGQYFSLNNNLDLKDTLAKADALLGMPSNKIIGEALDVWLAVASEVVKQFGVKELTKVTKDSFEEAFKKVNLNEAIDKHVTAEDRFTIGIHSDFFDEEVLKQALLQQNPNLKYNKNINKQTRTDLMDDGSVYYDINADNTEGKTDVEFVWPSGSKNIMMKMSDKNYSMSKTSQQIHILTKSPLLTLLQTENENNFANHYINVLAHSYKGKFSSEVDIQGYHNVFKQIIFIKGLTGRGIYGREKAASDYLVVNTRSDNAKHNTGIAIFSMSDLIKKARESLKMINFEGYPEDGENVGNKWVGSRTPSYEAATQRIGSVLNALYGYKISVSVRQSFLFHA